MDRHIFWLNIVKILKGNAWSRTGSALAIFGATCSFGWVDQVVGRLIGIDIPQPPLWFATMVMFTGVGLLIWGYSKLSLALESPNPNPHDVRLMGDFRDIFTNQLIEFLRNHNFGAPWNRNALDSLAEFAESWRGSRFEFSDFELNEILKKVKHSANDLEDLLASGSWAHRSNPDVLTVKTDVDYSRGVQKSTLDKIKKMNSAASRLVDDIDELEAAAREKRI